MRKKKGGKYFNTMPVINNAGELVAKYRKIHLFPYGLHEENYFDGGDEWSMVDTPLGTVWFDDLL